MSSVVIGVDEIMPGAEGGAAAAMGGDGGSSNMGNMTMAVINGLKL
jgi:hypothetical protein